MPKYVNKKVRQKMLKNKQSDLQATLIAILSQFVSFDMRKSNKIAHKTHPFLRIKRINRGKDNIDVMNYMRERSSSIKEYLVDTEGVKTSVAVHRLEQVKRKEVIHLLEDILIEFGGIVLIEKEETSGISGQIIIQCHLLEQFAHFMIHYPERYLPIDYNTPDIHEPIFINPQLPFTMTEQVFSNEMTIVSDKKDKQEIEELLSQQQEEEDKEPKEVEMEEEEQEQQCDKEEDIQENKDNDNNENTRMENIEQEEQFHSISQQINQIEQVPEHPKEDQNQFPTNTNYFSMVMATP